MPLKNHHHFAIFSLVILLSLFLCPALTCAQDKDSGLAPVSDADIASYRQFLDKLDAGDYRSIPIARDEMQRLFSKAPEDTAVEAFKVFRIFYSRAATRVAGFYGQARKEEYQATLNAIISGDPQRLGIVTNSLFNDDPLQTLQSYDEAFQKQIEERYGPALKDLRDMRDSGILFYWGEGDWYPGEDDEYLLNAGSFIKGDYLDFLRFQAEMGRERVAHDAALLISWDALRQRIILCENFEKKHPELPETKNEVLRELHRLVWFYLCGMPNTYAYDWTAMRIDPETALIDPELRKSYERFLSKNIDSAFFPVISKVIEILKRHDYNYSEELESYIKEMGYNQSFRDNGYSIFLTKYRQGFKD